MTPKEQLDKAMNALHDIAGAIFARDRLKEEDAGTSKYKLNPELRKSMEEKAMTDEQIREYALDVWEAIATELADKPWPTL